MTNFLRSLHKSNRMKAKSIGPSQVHRTRAIRRKNKSRTFFDTQIQPLLRSSFVA